MKCAQFICSRRFEAGAIPNRRRTFTHSLVGNVVSELLQRSRDAIVAPIPILASHTDDQVRDLSPDSRSSRIGAVFGTIKLLAISLRYHARMVSGCATDATCASA